MLPYITTALALLLLLMFSGVYKLAYIKLLTFHVPNSSPLKDAIGDIKLILSMALASKKDLYTHAYLFNKMLNESESKQQQEGEKDGQKTLH